MSGRTGKGFAGLSWPTMGRLRAENVRLKLLLDKAHDVAARYEMMLREGDHRIKNSLQIVSGLMSLQARREDSLTARNALLAAAARVQSIARIHDALQAGLGEDAVDLGRVLETMCWSLQAMAGDPRSVTVLVEVEPIEAPVSLAQPIALVVNELVVNALRHAFPDNRPGTVRVSAARVGETLHILVTDDGDGLPDGYADGCGYGMTLVRAMATQIGATLKIESSNGAQFTLTTPAPERAVVHN